MTTTMNQENQAAAPSFAQEGRKFQVGDEIIALWNGQWCPGKVVEHEKFGAYKICWNTFPLMYSSGYMDYEVSYPKKEINLEKQELEWRINFHQQILEAMNNARAQEIARQEDFACRRNSVSLDSQEARIAAEEEEAKMREFSVSAGVEAAQELLKGFMANPFVVDNPVDMDLGEEIEITHDVWKVPNEGAILYEYPNRKANYTNTGRSTVITTEMRSQGGEQWIKTVEGKWIPRDHLAPARLPEAFIFEFADCTNLATVNMRITDLLLKSDRFLGPSIAERNPAAANARYLSPYKKTLERMFPKCDIVEELEFIRAALGETTPFRGSQDQLMQHTLQLALAVLYDDVSAAMLEHEQRLTTKSVGSTVTAAKITKRLRFLCKNRFDCHSVDFFASLLRCGQINVQNYLKKICPPISTEWENAINPALRLPFVGTDGMTLYNNIMALQKYGYKIKCKSILISWKQNCSDYVDFEWDFKRALKTLELNQRSANVANKKREEKRIAEAKLSCAAQGIPSVCTGTVLEFLGGLRMD